MIAGQWWRIELRRASSEWQSPGHCVGIFLQWVSWVLLNPSLPCVILLPGLRKAQTHRWPTVSSILNRQRQKMLTGTTCLGFQKGFRVLEWVMPYCSGRHLRIGCFLHCNTWMKSGNRLWRVAALMGLLLSRPEIACLYVVRGWYDKNSKAHTKTYNSQRLCFHIPWPDHQWCRRQ